MGFACKTEGENCTDLQITTMAGEKQYQDLLPVYERLGKQNNPVNTSSDHANSHAISIHGGQSLSEGQKNLQMNTMSGKWNYQNLLEEMTREVATWSPVWS